MRRLLLVEDDPNRHKTIQSWLPDEVRLVWAKDAGAAVGVLNRARPGDYAGLLLDFDLNKSLRAPSSRHLHGGCVVDALLANPRCRGLPVLVHSMNARGSAEMVESLERGGHPVTKIRMAELTLEAFLEWLDELEE